LVTNMQPIDRRTFVRSSFTAAGLFSLPSLLDAFFAPQDPQPAQTPAQEPPRLVALRAALQRATAEGKPLLLFVVPADANVAWARGQSFGALLNHGGELALQELALCTLACASVADLRAVFGTAVQVSGEPLLLLVDVTPRTGDAAPRARAIDCELPKLPEGAARFGPPEGTSYEDWLAAEKKALLDGNAAIVAELHKVLHAGGDSLTQLAARAQATLTVEQSTALDSWFAGGAAPSDELIARATAIVRVAAGKRPDAERTATLAALQAAIGKVIVGRSVAGAQWARSAGCGESIEDLAPGEVPLAVACGMGHVPELAQRYLKFLTGS